MSTRHKTSFSTHSLIVALLLLVATTATVVHAESFVIVTIGTTDSPTPPATVELVSADGSRSEQTDDDQDSTVIFDVAAGTFDITVSAGDTSASATIDVPENGQVVAFYDPNATVDQRLSLATSTFTNEEITVTARRREESLQQTPLAITALTGTALEERSATDLSDTADYAPNVEFNIGGSLNGVGNEANVFIRGLGQNDNAIFTDPGVGIYVDGVYLARSQGAVLDLLALERVEILRGPQGTLFGKNTTGGAINLITRKPGGSRGGHVGVTTGEFSRLDLRAVADIPLGDRLDLTVAALTHNRDGYGNAILLGEELGDSDTDAARLALRYLGNDRFSLDLAADYSQQDERGLPQTLVAALPTPLIEFYNQPRVDAGLEPYDERWITGDLLDSNQTFPDQSEGEVWGVSGTASWRLGDFDLTSITAFRQLDFDNANDGDGSPLPLAARAWLVEQEQFTQELQINGATGAVDWVAGGLYFYEDGTEDGSLFLQQDLFAALEAAPGAIYAPPGLPDELCAIPGFPCFGGAGNPLNLAFFPVPLREVVDLETTSVALFGEATWRWSERFSVTGGLRYTRDEKDMVYTNALSGQRLTADDSWDAVSPRVSLAWSVDEDLLVYSTISRGFKSGGFNGRPQNRGVLDAFDPEYVLAYEVGFKSDSWDNRLRVNGAAFYNDFTDVQISAALNVDGQEVFITENAGEAESYGLELEVVARPSRQFEITGSAGWLETGFTDFSASLGEVRLDLDGELPRAPGFSSALSARWTVPIVDWGEATMRADYNWKSSYYTDIENSPFLEQEGFGLLNAHVAVSRGPWEVSAAGTNLTDERYLEAGFFAAAFGAAAGIPGRPREWSLGMRYRF
ncbi:MAG: TonB-dependent receptor [Acidobacteriota bacterium]